MFRPHIKDIFQSVAAKSNGEPCCDWVGLSYISSWFLLLIITILITNLLHIVDELLLIFQ